MNFFQRLFGKPIRKLFDDPRVGRRFCKIEMNGCMASSRGKELWGVVVAVGETSNRAVIVGDTCVTIRTPFAEAPKPVRNLSYRNRTNGWLQVKYDDGSTLWEPWWWCNDRGEHLEYQI